MKPIYSNNSLLLARTRSALRSLSIAAGMLIAASTVQADYTIALTSQGQAASTVQVGKTIDLDIVLNSPAADQHSSTVLRIEFSSSGLRYDSYFWTLPYLTGGEDDASTPAFAALPIILKPATVNAAGASQSAVDIYLSNLIPGAGSFSSGKLAQIRLTVPADYAGPETITITPIVEGLADGFRSIKISNSTPFRLNLIPATGTVQPALSVSIEGGLATLSWSAAIQDATVETTSDLADPKSWVPLSSSPTMENGRNTLVVPVGSSSLPSFFRLRFN